MKIGKITLYVEDQEKAKEFWIDNIGYELKIEQAMGPDAKWIEVGSKDQGLPTLVLYSKSMMEQQKPSNVCHPTILFTTTNIDSSYEKMKQNGVKVGELQKMPYGNMFTFYDQDGNEYLLREDK